MKHMHRYIFLCIFCFTLLVPSGIGSAEQYFDDITQVNGDLYIQENDIVHGDIFNLRGNTTIAGTVKGDIVNVWGDVILLDGASVSGDIIVTAGKVHREGNVSLNGSIVNQSFDSFKRAMPSNLGQRIFSAGVQFLGFLAFVALGISLFPNGLSRMASELRNDWGRVFLIGLVAWILYPFIMLVSIVTIVGIPLTIVLAMLIPVILVISALISALTLGRFHLRPMLSASFTWAKEPNLLIEGLLGMTVLWLVSMVPFVGWLVPPITAILGLGILMTTKFGTNKPWFSKNPRKNKEDDFYE